MFGLRHQRFTLNICALQAQYHNYLDSVSSQQHVEDCWELMLGLQLACKG